MLSNFNSKRKFINVAAFSIFLGVTSIPTYALDIHGMLDVGKDITKKTLEMSSPNMSLDQNSTVGKYAHDLYSKAQLSQSFNDCLSSFPNNNPNLVLNAFNDDKLNQKMQPTQLCSDGFAVVYSKVSKTPLVVVERLNASIIADARGEKRTDEFYPDPRLKQSERAELSDYKNSGYDRGHNAPAADAVDPHAMMQTFALSNMFPQDPENNRKLWSKIESDTRKYVQRAKGDVFVFTGPLFGKTKNQTIGANKVWVPTHLFKLVYDDSTKKSWAFIYENNDHPKNLSPIEYSDFLKATGYNLIN